MGGERMIDKANVDVTKLDSFFWIDIYNLLNDSPYLWRLVYGFRSIALQAELYNKYLQDLLLDPKNANKAAPPGKSAHNYGLAVDVVLVKDGKEIWNYLAPEWSWLWLKVKLHPRLHSGQTFGDPDHIQSLTWTAKRYEQSAT